MIVLKNNELKNLLILLFIAPVTAVFAETTYVTDEFSVGLHEDKSSDSPIIKLVQSGSDLEIVKQEDTFTYVRDSDGTNGWIDNTYLKDEAPSVELSQTQVLEIQRLQQQLAEAQTEIDKQKLAAQSAGNNDSGFATLQTEYKSLQQAFNSEQLKAGELQVQLAELRKRIGQDNDNASLYNEIEGLEQDKKQLEIQLAAILEREGLADLDTPVQSNSSESSWRNTLIYYSITLFLGFCGGIYLMDYFNRRRHAGLRI